MMAKVNIVVCLISPSLNELPRNWQGAFYKKKKLQKDWYYAIRSYWGRKPIIPLANATIQLQITYWKKSQFRDDSNIIGGFKAIEDILCSPKKNQIGLRLGFIKDDNTKCLTWLKPIQQTGNIQQTEIILTGE